MITCAQAVSQLWEYLDGELPAESHAAVEEHLSFCRQCCGEAEFAAELRSFLAREAAEELPDDVHERLLSTLDQIASGE